MYRKAFSSALENCGVLVPVPVNGNKRGTAGTFPRTYRNYLLPAEGAVQVIAVFKYPYSFFRQESYNAHNYSIAETEILYRIRGDSFFRTGIFPNNRIHHIERIIDQRCDVGNKFCDNFIYFPR